MSVKQVGLKLASQPQQSALSGLHEPPFSKYGHAGGYFFGRWSTIKMKPIDVFFRYQTIDLLWAGQVEGLPAQPALLPQDACCAERVPGVQWEGMVQKVQNAHGVRYLQAYSDAYFGKSEVVLSPI